MQSIKAKEIKFQDLLELATQIQREKVNPENGIKEKESIVKSAAVIIHYKDDTIEVIRAKGFDETNFDFVAQRIYEADTTKVKDKDVHDDAREAKSILMDLKTKNK